MRDTYVTCFPANKYVFSILTRFTSDGVWEDGGLDDDDDGSGVDTDA